MCFLGLKIYIYKDMGSDNENVLLRYCYTPLVKLCGNGSHSNYVIIPESTQCNEANSSSRNTFYIETSQTEEKT